MKPETKLPFRCAIYFAPPIGSAWHDRGSQWLGRDAATGRASSQPDVPGLTASRLRELTAAPRRYGWHATLKPPFSLAPGQDLDSLRQALRDLAGQLAGFKLPPLQAAPFDDFLALRPVDRCAPLNAVAAACVTQLQPLAAPPDQTEIARRRAAGLTLRQEILLQRWNYPWVLEEFRFHLSLTSALDDASGAERDALVKAARAHFEGLPGCAFDRLSLFVEPHKGADFQLVEQVELRG